MKNLIIRDDDLSYWTKTEDIERVYRPLFEKGVKISFAVIPYAVKMHNAGNFDLMYQDEDSAKAIGENREIVEYIKDKIDKGLVEIMLHGYNHLYSLKTDDMIYVATKFNTMYMREKKKSFYFLGEYIDEYDKLYAKTKEGKKYLEDLFGVKISDFVPPSNQIVNDGVRAVADNGLNISGIAGKKYDREINAKGLVSYSKRVLFKMSYPNLTYPYVIDYGTHKELAGYAFTPSTDWQRYENQLSFCEKNDLPFQIATHYWELEGELLQKYYDFIKKVFSKGYKSAFLNEVLR